LGAVVAGEAGDVAAGVGAGTAEVEGINVGAVVASSGEGAVVAYLVIGECADEEIAFVHVVEGSFGVEGGLGEGIKDGVFEVGGVFGPEV